MKASWSLAVLVAFLSACGQDGSPGSSAGEPGSGRARLSMTGTGTDGVSYRIVGWTLQFDGPESRTVADVSDDPVTVPLKAGSYSVRLGGNWSIERTDAPGMPVEVTLVSPNPLSIVVWADEDTLVRFLFKLPAQGSATVSMGIDAGGFLSGSFLVQSAGDPTGDGVFSDLVGAPLTFTLSYDSSRVTRAPGRTTVDTGPVTVQFGGSLNPVLIGEVAENLSGSPYQFELDALGSELLFSSPGLMAGVGSVLYQLSLTVNTIPAAYDANGAPRLGTFTSPAVLQVTRDGATLEAVGDVTMQLR